MFFPDTASVETFLVEAMSHDLGDFTISYETDGLMTIRTPLFDLQVYYKERLVCRRGVVTTSLEITGLFVNDKWGKDMYAFSPAALEYYQNPLSCYNNPLAYKAKLKERISEWSASRMNLALEALFE